MKYGSNTDCVMLLAPQDVAGTDTVSLILDTANYHQAAIAVVIGAQTGVDSTNYLTPVLQECATTVGTSFTSVGAADLSGPGFSKVDATSEDDVVQWAYYTGSKRYIRVNLDFTNTGITAGECAVIGILSEQKNSEWTAPAALSAT